MIIDFSEKLESVQNEKLKRAIICQCALDSFIAVTQEINSILAVLKNEEIAPNELIEYVENKTDRMTPYLLERLTKIHGDNLLRMSEKLNKDLTKYPRLSTEESIELLEKEKELSVDYFMKCNPIISQKLDKYVVELLEKDSI